MKAKHLLLLSGIGLIILSSYTMMNPTGAPAGYTGSPADGKNCTQCHGGTAVQAPGAISSNIPANGYTPGQTYQITATNTLTGTGKYGFQVSPQNTAGTLLGTLTAGIGSKIVGSKYITHSNANTSQKEWTFNWTAPAAGTGEVTFYGAFANDKPGPVSLSTLIVQELNTTSISETTSNKIIITPNPNQGNFKASLPSFDTFSASKASIINMAGIEIQEIDILPNSQSITINMNTRKPGVYFLVIEDSNRKYSSKFVVR